MRPAKGHDMNFMQIFTHLDKIRAFEKRYLPELITLEDFDIVRVIGLRQELGQVFLLKHLFLAGISSVSTVTRRMERLRKTSIIVTGALPTDRRVITLQLSPATLKTYQRYAELLGAR